MRHCAADIRRLKKSAAPGMAGADSGILKPKTRQEENKMKEFESWRAPFEDNAALRAYFDTLPRSIQEMLVQSGAQVQCVRELRDCVAHLQQKE